VLVMLVLTAATSGSLWLPGMPPAADLGADAPGMRRLNGPAPVPLPEVGVVEAPPPTGGLDLPGPTWIDTAVQVVQTAVSDELPSLDAAPEPALPAWVQAHRSTPLWSGPDGEAVVLTELPQWTFLRTLGLSHLDRLLVEYAGDYATRPAGLGWVDAAAIGPSADPGRWVSNHRPTPLWSGPDDAAVSFTTIPQWTRLRIVEAGVSSPSRLQVEFLGDARGRQPGLAWVDRADVGPVTPPEPMPGGPGFLTRASDLRTFTSEAEFIEAVGSIARRAQRSTGVPASVTIAQAILESDWGRSRLTREAHNLFGIKALAGPGTAGTITLATWEHLGNLDLVIQSAFRAYHTLEESVTDHAAFFVQNGRYADALAVSADPQAFARAINQAGYATDPRYASKLIRLMDRYDLYRFDGPT
jgi:hypothetical protein